MTEPPFTPGEFVSLEKYDAKLSPGSQTGIAQVKAIHPTQSARSGFLVEVEPITPVANFMLDMDWLTKL